MKQLNKEQIDAFFEKLSKLTTVHKALICIGTYVLLIIPFVFLSYKPSFEKIQKLEKDLAAVEEKYRTAKKKADQLEKIKAEWEKATEQFLLVRQSLPEEQQIPGLLENVSKSGLQSGLEFKRFKPAATKDLDFYSEISFTAEVTGGFQNFVLFCDKVANLSRIVKIQDIDMKQEKDTVFTSCKAITYKFIEKK